MSATERVKNALKKFEIEPEIIEFNVSTKTSAAAAEAVGCTLSQIAKSILFKGKKSGEPIMVVACGSNLIDSKKVKKLVGENIRTADVDFVRENTGYDVGGVAPLGHLKEFKIFLDEDFYNFEEVWAAAGTSNSMFKVTPEQLKLITNGIVADIKKEK